MRFIVTVNNHPFISIVVIIALVGIGFASGLPVISSIFGFFSLGSILAVNMHNKGEDQDNHSDPAHSKVD
jgi:hypothetical protein